MTNRRNLFSLLAAPFVALVVPAEALTTTSIQSLKAREGGLRSWKGCQHTPITALNGAPSILHLEQVEEGTERLFTAEFRFCRECGELYTEHTQEALPPLPESSLPGVEYMRQPYAILFGGG